MPSFLCVMPNEPATPASPNWSTCPVTETVGLVGIGCEIRLNTPPEVHGPKRTDAPPRTVSIDAIWNSDSGNRLSDGLPYGAGAIGTSSSSTVACSDSRGLAPRTATLSFVDDVD